MRRAFEIALAVVLVIVIVWIVSKRYKECRKHDFSTFWCITNEAR